MSSRWLEPIGRSCGQLTVCLSMTLSLARLYSSCPLKSYYFTVANSSPRLNPNCLPVYQLDRLSLIASASLIVFSCPFQPLTE